MSRHKNFVVTNLSFFAAPEKCRDINFFVVTNIFDFSSSTLSRHVATFFQGFFSTFVGTIFSFFATKFLTVACCCCRDRPFLCRDIVLLSCTIKTELRVATNSKDVTIYFLL